MKLPVVDEMDRVMEATTLPTLLLGGDPADPDEAFASWAKALTLPSVRGLIVGRTLLYPADDNVVRRGRDCGVDGALMHSKFYIPARSAARRRSPSTSPRSRPGGPNPSLQVVELDDGAERSNVHTGDTEVMVVPLAGGGDVRCDGENSSCRRAHRCSTARPTWSTSARTASTALCRRGTVRDVRRPGRTGRSRTGAVAAADVPVELRGAGNCSRQVHNFATADVVRGRLDHRLRGDHPRRQLVVLSGAQARREHRHRNPARGDLLLRDRRRPGRLAGFGYHRVYGTPDRPIDVLEEVRSGDVVLVPHGYHGPSIAAPGYHMYYLNVMAGPGPKRAWLIGDDPEQDLAPRHLGHQDIDPRLPLRDPRGD